MNFNTTSEMEDSKIPLEEDQKAEGIKEEVLDYGFVEVDSNDVHQLCTACLCATRTTHTLDDVTLKQYYMNILTETQLEAGEPVLQSPRLCWECVAHLKRSVRFREQVQDSYRLLQPMLLMCDKEDLAEFLQTSVRRPGRLSTCFAHSIDISAQDDTQLMTATEHDDDNAAAEEYLLEKNSEELLSTFREMKTIDEETFESFCDKNIVVCVSEDLDEHSNETLVAQTRNQVKTCVTTTYTPNLTYECSDSKCSESSDGHRLLQHIDVKTNAAEKHHQRELFQNQPLIHNKSQNSVKKRFQCDVCHKSFIYKSLLIVHTKTHTGEKLFQCEVCHKSFAKKSHLNGHRRIHTGEKLFQCEVCHKSFATKCHLNGHRRIHTGEKPFQCEVCDKSFAQKSHLVGHRRIHTGEKPFQCEICPKSFALQTDLIKHRRTHTGEKPYQCEVCHKSFVQHCILIDHRRIHTGEKPFQCEVCSKSFARQGDLNKHMRTHTGEKPYLCEICLKSFARINNLVRHRRAHTGEISV